MKPARHTNNEAYWYNDHEGVFVHYDKKNYFLLNEATGKEYQVNLAKSNLATDTVLRGREVSAKEYNKALAV